MCPIEKVTLWVVHGVPHREGYSMGGPWCTSIEKITQWVGHGMPHREGYSMDGHITYCQLLRCASLLCEAKAIAS